MSNFYVTTYCNMAHRVSDGVPIDHMCAIIPPAALAAEMEGDYAKAIQLLDAGKTRSFYGMPSLPTHPGVKE